MTQATFVPISIRLWEKARFVVLIRRNRPRRWSRAFRSRAEVMLDQFKDKKKADAELATVRSSADQIDKLLASTPMGDKVATNWSKVKSELGTISSAFGIDNQPATTNAK